MLTWIFSSLLETIDQGSKGAQATACRVWRDTIEFEAKQMGGTIFSLRDR